MSTVPDPQQADRRSLLFRNPAYVAFLAAALLVLFGGWQIQRAYRTALSDAVDDTRNLSRSLAQHMERSIEAVDLILTSLVERIEDGAMQDEARFKDFLISRSKVAIQARALVVIDAEGHWVVHSAATPRAPVSNLDRAFFRWHRDNTDRGLHIDHLITGRLSGKGIVPLSRRWNKPDGSFGGVVMAALNPDYFEGFYRRLAVGEHGAIALISEDKHFLIRHPFDPELAGRDLSKSPLFRQGRLAAREGVTRYASAIDGVDRIASYEYLSAYPALVLAARSVDDVLAPWRREAALQGSVLAAAALVLVGMGGGLARHRRRTLLAEAAIRASEAKQREILDTANDAFISVDREDRVLAMNAAAERMFGWPAREALGRSLGDTMIPRRVRETYTAGMLRYVGTDESLGEGQRLDLVALRRDGSEFPIEVTVSATGSGEARALNAFIQDISERKARDEALAQSEARYRLLAENTSELIMLGHDDGRRSYISPASQRVLGFTPDELAAMSLRDYVHPEDLKTLYGATSRLGRGENQVQVSYRALHKTRGWVWVEGSFRRIPGTSGDEPTIVATFRDIGERRRHEAEIEAAKDAAELASRAKTEFLASMSHEIRTPLNGVIGFTGLILDRPALEPDLRRQVELIRSSGSALLTIVNDILDFSKIEADEVELVPHPFSPAVLIDEAVSMVRGQADANGTALTVSLDADVAPSLSGDADRLRQILLNLLNNAVKFTRRGQVSVKVACPTTEGESRLRVTVADTGIGIPEDKLGRLFQRFSQVDGSVQREFGGTGLGLAISKRLIELMGGEIGVESVQGRGSSFWFSVPLPRLAAMPPKRTEAAEPRAVRSGRILVVDDIAMNLEIARAVLEAAGHRVEEAGDGADAITAVEHATFDLVLMDVQMPLVDGLTATRHIRTLPAPVGAVPILAMTANVLPDQIAAVLAAGMNGHVGKPFKREELLDAVDRVLRTKDSSADEAPEPESPPVATDAGNVVAIDRDALDALGDMLSPDVVGSLFVRLRQQIESGALIIGRTPADPQHADPQDIDPGALAREAHALVSSAGLLGFARVSRLCQHLEAAIQAGDEAGALRDEVAEACVQAVEIIASQAARGTLVAGTAA